MKSRIDQSESESEQTKCWGTTAHTSMLRVESRDGSFQLCPYAWLVWVKFSVEGKNDCLTLSFNNHTVRVTGTKLRALGLAVQSLSVEWIKEQPEHFNGSKRDGGPSVESIKIAERALDGTSEDT